MRDVRVTVTSSGDVYVNKLKRRGRVNVRTRFRVSKSWRVTATSSASAAVIRQEPDQVPGRRKPSAGRRAGDKDA